MTIKTKYNIFTIKNGSVEIFKKSTGKSFFIMEQELAYVIAKIKEQEKEKIFNDEVEKLKKSYSHLL